MIFQKELKQVGSEITAIQAKLNMIRSEIYRNPERAEAPEVKKELEDIESKADSMLGKYSRPKRFGL